MIFYLIAYALLITTAPLCAQKSVAQPMQQANESDINSLVHTTRQYFNENTPESVHKAIYLLESILSQSSHNVDLDWIPQQYVDLVQTGYQLLDNQKYDQAISLFITLLHALESKTLNSYITSSAQVSHEYRCFLIYALAYAHYKKNNFDATQGLLDITQVAEKALHIPKKLYESWALLLGASFEQQGNLRKALDVYTLFLNTQNRNNTETLLYQKGYILYRLRRFDEAKQCLEILAPLQSSASLPAIILLTHIDLQEKRLQDAQNRIHIITSSTEQKPISQCIQAVLHIQEDNPEKGILLLKELLNYDQESPDIHWRHTAQIWLLEALRKLAEKDLLYRQDQASLCLDDACKLLQQLHPKEKQQEDHLYITTYSLIKAYIHYLQWQIDQDPKHQDELSLLYTQLQTFSQDVDSLLELQLIIMATHPITRLKHIDVPHENVKNTHYSYLFCTISCLLQEISTTISTSNSNDIKKQLDKAISLIHLLTTKYTHQDSHQLVQLVIQLVTICDPKALQTAKELMEFIPKENNDRYVYCEIMTALHPVDFDLILQFVTDYPNSTYVPQLVHAMANRSIEEKDFANAQELLELLQYNFPQYDREDHLLYLMALCADQYELQQEKAAALRKELYTSYPASPYAMESYYRYYPEIEYKRGTPKAIAHLKQMAIQYPNNIYTAYGLYYTGRFQHAEASKRQFIHAKPFYQEATNNFSRVKTLIRTLCDADDSLKKKNPDLTKILLFSDFFLGKILVKRAQEEKNNDSLLKEAQEIFEQMSNDQISDTFSVHVLLESSYQLAKVLQYRQQVTKAIQQLKLIMTHPSVPPRLYIRASILLTRQYLLSSKGQEALNVLSNLHADQIAKTYPNIYLKVLISKSYCFRDAKRFDKAMSLLSQAINYNFASSLRIKAMVLRAEIYTLQKRQDLAIKQLETASQYEGKWGTIAKQRLETYYEQY